MLIYMLLHGTILLMTSVALAYVIADDSPLAKKWQPFLIGLDATFGRITADVASPTHICKRVTECRTGRSMPQ
jgi:hypothetical protein